MDISLVMQAMTSAEKTEAFMTLVGHMEKVRQELEKELGGVPLEEIYKASDIMWEKNLLTHKAAEKLLRAWAWTTFCPQDGIRYRVVHFINLVDDNWELIQFFVQKNFR